MIKVKQNFSTQFNQNLLCILGCNEEETQQHLLDCKNILDRLNNKYILSECEYSDLFGNIKEQVQITKIFSEILQIRKEIEETL